MKKNKEYKIVVSRTPEVSDFAGCGFLRLALYRKCSFLWVFKWDEEIDHKVVVDYYSGCDSASDRHKRIEDAITGLLFIHDLTRENCDIML